MPKSLRRISRLLPKLPAITIAPEAFNPIITTPIELTPSVPEVVQPAPSTALSLTGKLHIVVMAHADGLAQLKDLASWKTLALSKAAEFKALGIPVCIALTKEEVTKISDKTWFASMSDLGIQFAAREPHTSTTAEQAYEALVSKGIVPAKHLGSYLDATKYVGRQWSVLTCGATIGHTADPDWSGFRVIEGKTSTGEPIIAIGSGTANSIAKKRGIVREVKTGQREWAVEVIMFNAVGLKGATEHFVTPATHDGTYAPKSIFDELARMLEEITSDGNTDIISFTDPVSVTAIATTANQLVEYTVAKS